MTSRVHFHTPVGVPVQFEETVEMPAVPRQDDSVNFDRDGGVQLPGASRRLDPG
jgi:hypothetical protein